MSHEIPTSSSRRGFLKAAVGGIAGAAVAGYAPEALASPEEREKRTIESLSRPRIDWDMTNDIEKILQIEDVVHFPVKEVSVPLQNRISTECVRLIYGENGEFAWLWTIQPGGKVPFKHHHLSDEKVTLRSGTLHCWLKRDGRASIAIAKAGEGEFIIPSGTDHQPFVPADGEPVAATVHFDLEESAARVTTLYWNMVNDGLMNAKGQPDFLKMMLGTFAEEERTYISDVPRPVQDIAREIVHFFQRDRKGFGETDRLDTMFEK